MNDLYELVNISNIPLETRIKTSISQTRELLKNIDINRRCATYSKHLYRFLSKNHVIGKIVNTKDLGAEYEHYFVIVPINTFEYYLIDLTYPQFKNKEFFKDLYVDGYEIITDLNFYLYYQLVTGEQSEMAINDIFLDNKKTR